MIPLITLKKNLLYQDFEQWDVEFQTNVLSTDLL